MVPVFPLALPTAHSPQVSHPRFTFPSKSDLRGFQTSAAMGAQSWASYGPWTHLRGKALGTQPQGQRGTCAHGHARIIEPFSKRSVDKSSRFDIPAKVLELAQQQTISQPRKICSLAMPAGRCQHRRSTIDQFRETWRKPRNLKFSQKPTKATMNSF